MLSDKRLKRYRPNVGVALFNRNGQVWVGRRIGKIATFGDDPGGHRWQMPQGGIDAGENVASAAFRELAEETGVTTARLLVITPGWMAYDFPTEEKKRDWKGQRQKWAAMIFEGEENEINLNAHHKQEFDEWRWVELEEATHLIVPFKRAIYAELTDSFTPLRDHIRAAC